MFKKIVSKLQAKKKATGVQRIISLANALSKEIMSQGYKLKDEVGFGSIYIWLNRDGSISVEDSASGLCVKGKQEVME